MANKVYTGIFAKTLLKSDLNSTGFDGLAITAGVPVELTYQVLPSNEVAFGSGSKCKHSRVLHGLTVSEASALLAFSSLTRRTPPVSRLTVVSV